MKIKLKKNEILVFKRCFRGSESFNGFKYPKKGMVEAKDWKATSECGNGLHGWTFGSDSYYESGYNGNFLVLKVNKKDGFVDLGDKVKFRKGKVILNTENAQEAIELMRSVYPEMVFNWDMISKGDDSSIIQGHCSTATQGNHSVAKQGYYSTAIQRDYSVAKQGYYSSVEQGYFSAAIQDDCSVAKQGSYSTVTQRNHSKANQGNNSVANQGSYSYLEQGYFSSAIQDDCSVAKQGNRSTVTQGDYSTISQGNHSIANQGFHSTANQGNHSVARQGFCSSINQWYFSAAIQDDCSVAKQDGQSTVTIYGGNLIYRSSSVLSAIIMFYKGKMKIFKGGKDYQANETIKIKDGKIIKKYTNTRKN